MEKEFKREKIVRLAKDDPFLTVEKIATLADTTARYVRTVLYENNISLQELRKLYALRWKPASEAKEGAYELERLLYPLAQQHIDATEIVHLTASKSKKIKEGIFTAKDLVLKQISFPRVWQLCKQELLAKEWVEVLSNIYLVHIRVYHLTEGKQIFFYQAGLAMETVLIKVNSNLNLTYKENSVGYQIKYKREGFSEKKEKSIK